MNLFGSIENLIGGAARTFVVDPLISTEQIANEATNQTIGRLTGQQNILAHALSGSDKKRFKELTGRVTPMDFLNAASLIPTPGMVAGLGVRMGVLGAARFGVMEGAKIGAADVIGAGVRSLRKPMWSSAGQAEAAIRAGVTSPELVLSTPRYHITPMHFGFDDGQMFHAATGEFGHGMPKSSLTDTYDQAALSTDPYLSDVISHAEKLTTDQEKMTLISEIEKKIKDTRKTMRQSDVEGASIEATIKEHYAARDAIVGQLSEKGQIRFHTQKAAERVESTIKSIERHASPKQGEVLKSKFEYTKKVKGKAESTPIYALELSPADVAAAQWRLQKGSIQGFVEHQVTEGSRALSSTEKRHYVVMKNTEALDRQQAGMYARASAKEPKRVLDAVDALPDKKRATDLRNRILGAISESSATLKENAAKLRPAGSRSSYRLYEVRPSSKPVGKLSGEEPIVRVTRDGQEYNLIPLSEGMDHLISKSTISKRVIDLITAGKDDAAVAYMKFMNSFDNFFALHPRINSRFKSDAIWTRETATREMARLKKTGEISASDYKALEQDWEAYLSKLDAAHAELHKIATEHGLSYEEELKYLKEHSKKKIQESNPDQEQLF